MSGPFLQLPRTHTFKSVMRTVYNQNAYNINYHPPRSWGNSQHLLCLREKFCAKSEATSTINPIFLGQRFPKRGMQNNFRSNKDALFILIDRYLFILMIIRKITGFHYTVVMYVSTLNQCIGGGEKHLVNKQQYRWYPDKRVQRESLEFGERHPKKKPLARCPGVESAMGHETGEPTGWGAGSVANFRR